MSGPGLAVRCRRGLTSSSRGRRWLLQGHCTELINGPSYVAAVCLMSLIMTDHTFLPETHTYSESLGLSTSPLPSPASLSLFLFSNHFSSQRHRNSFNLDNTASVQTGTCINRGGGATYTCPPPAIHKQFVQCVYLHISAPVHTHLVTQRGGETWSRDLCFGSFLNGNFCSALMFAALPTRPLLQLWNERRNIYLKPK